MGRSYDLAKDLLDIKAVQISPDDYFTWTSGIKSPIYCDNRLTMSYPRVRSKIADGFVELIKQMERQPDVIAGCATAGIPHAAWVAEKLDLPMVYVRSRPKSHGKANQIEGRVETGQHVVVIEDLISTGGSSIETANVLEQEGANVLGVLAIFTYGLEKAEQQFSDAQIKYHSITDYNEILNLLSGDGTISKAEQQELEEWRHQI
ncbi:orotate phosphoribosyltransferase [Lentibacillus amyloliquefaciens]|uniref:Orotate phosphoribosyltransferase n=1 Tax=Lentibacillus amyloliquefaciens TaxID=1472767 RepID=A0A0U4E3D4_9BACI|nr:orotate phosphoribosyltransferase [Lentibacillus amyloliquefaciens]ALX47409.1 orotate phosphoribosyltransferase [Lentibacillus amyloliquefaciens]